MRAPLIGVAARRSFVIWRLLLAPCVAAAVEPKGLDEHRLTIVGRVPATYEPPFFTMAMAGRGRYLATTKHEPRETSTLWDLSTNAKLFESRGIICGVADDGQTVLMSGTGKNVFRRRENDWRPVSSGDNYYEPRAQFSPDGRFQAYPTKPSQAFKWRIAEFRDESEPVEYDVLPGSLVLHVAPSTSGNAFLAVVRDDPLGDVQAVECDLATGMELRRMRLFPGPSHNVPGEFLAVEASNIYAVGFVNNAARTGLCLVQCFDKRRKEQCSQILLQEDTNAGIGMRDFLAISPDGRFVAVCDAPPARNSVHIFATDTGALLNKLPAKIGELQLGTPRDGAQGNFSADSKSFYVHAHTGLVLRWDFLLKSPPKAF